MYLSARAFIKIVTFITYHLDDELTSSIKINL